MGKIRVKTFDEEQEERDKKREAQREQKKAKKAHISGMKGGERTVIVGATAEELEKTPPLAAESPEQPQPEKKKKAKFAKKKVKGKRYAANAAMVDKKTLYPLDSALTLLKKFKTSGFDETIELHVNVKEKGISGQVVLPHGSGKKLRIKVADDAVITLVEQGKIDFDILLAHPSMMPKLAKVARILGPRGLMPNPKNGTITDKPEEAVKKLSAGQINFKTEAAAPIIHLSVGKISFDENKLKDNVNTALSSIGASKIISAVLKSTMSPAIKLQLEKSS